MREIGGLRKRTYKGQNMHTANPSVLIVEDAPLLLDFLMQWFRLTFPERRVVGVGSIAAAHGVMELIDVDCMLVDYQLTDGTALDFISDVRSVDPNARFVLMTGGMADSEHKQMMALNRRRFFER